MADYIDREAAIENIVKHSYPVRYDYASIENGMTITGIRQALDELPAADVKPVERGKWELTTEQIGFPKWNCSCCGGEGRGDYWFCPWCGADMRGNDNV